MPNMSNMPISQQCPSTMMPTMSNMPISQQCPSSEPQTAPQKLPPHLQYFHDLFNNPAANQPGMGMPSAPNPQAMQALQAIMASKRAAPTAAPIPVANERDLYNAQAAIMAGVRRHQSATVPQSTPP